MNFIDTFRDFYGQDKINQIYEYIIDNEILEEFEKVKNDKQALFSFAVKHGIFEIVKFLYERINIEYNINVILGFNSILESGKIAGTNISSLSIPIGTGSSNDRVNIQVWDKFTKNRNICITYLINMIKYSKQRSSNKKFYYRFNPKYIHLLA